MPTIASQQDLAAAAEPLLQHSSRGGATDARQDGEVCPITGQAWEISIAMCRDPTLQIGGAA